MLFTLLFISSVNANVGRKLEESTCTPGWNLEGNFYLREKCCNDNDNKCCPVGFDNNADNNCCNPDGICCELDDAVCTCKDGSQLTPFPTAQTYVPNGCGAEHWSADFLPDVNQAVFDVWSASCTNHDMCYVDCSKTQQECDSQFLTDMKADCEAAHAHLGWFKRAKRTRLCKRMARNLYNLIRFDGNMNLGGRSYRLGREEYCSCSISL